MIISLLILLVMTLIGVAAMNSTTLGERMSSNSQYQTVAFQIAESAIQSVWFVDAVEPTMADPDQTVATAFGNVFSPNTAIQSNADAEIVYCGFTNPIGGELDADEGNANRTVSHIFDITGTGIVTDAGAAAEHEQRGSALGPSNFRKVLCPDD